MSHDSSPSSAARQRALPPDADDADEAGEPSSAAAQDDERKQKLRAGRAKKLQAVTHLQKSLDMIVFAYLCALYYMECSFARLLLRVLPHYVFISPKEGPLSLPAHRPHVFAIFLPNLLCTLFHCVFALPQAGEATRGYLHGGVLIDFVGQRPPTWTSVLLLFDLIIWAVQCLMLAVHEKREVLRKQVNPALGQAAGAQPDAAAAETTTQDLDAEERGVLREDDDDGLVETDGGIEMQPLSGAAAGSSSRMDEAYSRTTADLVDVMWSGNAVLANFHVVNAVRRIGNDVQEAAAYSLQSLGYTAGLAAAIAAERRARMAHRRRRPR
ncbi:DSC E3 ubiquitin ligase complex subunit 4 [Podospora conica]|nr:DSC E3 ubiquitin ligase complex subunit 4 [Schizothecium conicum]